MTANQTMQKAPNKRSARLRMFDSSEAASLWFDIFNGVLLTGAFLVAVGTWGTIKTAGIKERFSDERIAVNEAETKRSIADSDAAKEGTAKANERIAELSIQSEKLQKETAEANARALEAKLELEKYRESRTLNPAQRSDVSEAIKPFIGQTFDIAIPPGDSESATLLNDIEAVLKDAGWKQSDWQDRNPSALRYTRDGLPSVGTTVAIGVHVGMDKSKESDFWPAAEALATALNDSGIPSLAEKTTVRAAANDSAIHILIGKKF